MRKGHILKFKIQYNKDRKDYYIKPFPYPQVVADKVNQLIDRVDTLERLVVNLQKNERKTIDEPTDSKNGL